MGDAGHRRAKRRASALREAIDAHEEARATGDMAAFERRNRAMREGTTSEEFRYMNERLQEEMVNERDAKRRENRAIWRKKG